MRQIAVDAAIAHLTREGVDFHSAALEVGGSRQVYIETLDRAGGYRRALRDAVLWIFGESAMPQREIIVATNPLLNLFANITLLDQGFNGTELGTEMDIRGDFLDSRVVESLGGKYDVALSFDTLEHVRDPFLFCRHLARCVKPGGLIYLSTVFSCPYHPSPFDYFRFSPEGLKECFSDSGAELIQTGWDEKGVGVFVMLRKANLNTP